MRDALDFLTEVRSAGPQAVRMSFDRFVGALGFSLTEEWQLERGVDGSISLTGARTEIAASEAGLRWLATRRHSVLEWAMAQSSPFIIHPQRNIAPPTSRAGKVIENACEDYPSKLSFFVPRASGYTTFAISSDMPLADLDETHRRSGITIGMAAYVVATQGAVPSPDLDIALTPREAEALTWLASGLRNERIAEKMGITVSTVDLHIANARSRLGARTREQALVAAIRLNLISP